MPALLIVNADDLGYDPAVTRGILEAAKQGIVSSTTLMVNTPFSEEAASLAGGLSVGLHLNLSRWSPAWARFPPELLQAGLFSEARAKELPAEVVEEETWAQLERLEALRGQPATHLDVHKHLHRHPGVLEGVASAARRRGLPVRSIDRAMRARLRGLGVATPDHFLGEAGAEPCWTLERLCQALESLPEAGVVELMCHPGYSPSSVSSGYSSQREVELEALTHPRARALVERLGIELVDYLTPPWRLAPLRPS